MNVTECGTLLSASLAGSRCSAPDGSWYHRTGGAILRMASAYESDGTTFAARGDPVNAFAAYLYGLGWLHFGAASGLLVPGPAGMRCPFGTGFGTIDGLHAEKLAEKTDRYERLLETAIASVTLSPDPGSGAAEAATRVLFIAKIYLARGGTLRAGGRNEDALACFSYGHGWIDAAVEAGLFRIVANRGIFTVD